MPGLASVVDIVRRHDSFLILCHEEPDGDALGASLALQAGLESLGKKADVVCRDEPALPFRFLPGVERLRHDFLAGEYQVMIIVDCGDIYRTGFAERILAFGARGRPIVNIDHHPQNDLHRLASANLTDPEAAASVQLILALLSALGVSLTPEMATHLLTGLYTDTGGFRHSNTTPAVLRTASLLLAQGARLKKIVQNVATTKTLPALRLWGVALTRVRRHPTLPVVTSVVRREDMVRCQAGPEDLGGVVNLINSIPGAQVAVLLTELSDCEIKVSLRTETEVIDVSRIATLFGGGGHRKAAGFRIRGRVVEQNGRWEIVSDSPLVQDRAEQPLSLGFTSPTPGVEAGR